MAVSAGYRQVRLVAGLPGSGAREMSDHLVHAKDDDHVATMAKSQGEHRVRGGRR